VALPSKGIPIDEEQAQAEAEDPSIKILMSVLAVEDVEIETEATMTDLLIILFDFLVTV
jgi:hypothetical protein